MLCVNTDDSPFLFCSDKFRYKKITSDEMILWFDFQNRTEKGVSNVFQTAFI